MGVLYTYSFSLPYISWSKTNIAMSVFFWFAWNIFYHSHLIVFWHLCLGVSLTDSKELFIFFIQSDNMCILTTEYIYIDFHYGYDLFLPNYFTFSIFLTFSSFFLFSCIITNFILGFISHGIVLFHWIARYICLHMVLFLKF